MHTRSKFRLLVVRLGAMGDILHALPAVTALRQAHPEWIIDWVVESRWQSLLTARAGVEPRLGPAQPVVNQVHLTLTKDWRRSPLSRKTLHEIFSLRRDLIAGNYDVVLDLQGALRSALLARLTGCQRRIGEAEPREKIATWLSTELVATHGLHVIEQDVELATSIAADDLAPVQPWLPVEDEAEAWAARLIAADSPAAVLINPGAGWGAKRWPVERYGMVASSLVSRGYRVLVNAGPGEQALAQGICAAANTPGQFQGQDEGQAVALTCSIAQLISITRRAALVIAGDTGPLHLACALGRPVVGIYGPTDPSRNGPFGSRFKILRSPLSRRDHTRHAAPEAGLLTIQPEAVLLAADELLHQNLPTETTR